MELHPLHGQVPVPDTHDLAIVGPRGHFETGGQAFLFDDQRMVARASQRIGQPVENAGILEIADLADGIDLVRISGVGVVLNPMKIELQRSE